MTPAADGKLEYAKDTRNRAYVGAYGYRSGVSK